VTARSTRRADPPHRGAGLDALRFGAAVALVLLLAKLPAAARCQAGASQEEVDAALAVVQRSVDPCGGSAELVSTLRAFARCGAGAYPICLDRASQRSFIDQGTRNGVEVTTITWNPELRTELEADCSGDASRPVLRDPTASLLHEIVHAVQDCEGLVPADHEFEAVRIENIYRRARGLCQRTRYGSDVLPASMVVSCVPGHCSCERESADLIQAAVPAAPHPGRAAAPARRESRSAGDTRTRSALGGD